MKTVMLYTGSGPMLLLTSYDSATEPGFVASLKARGIHKFVAYEVPLEKTRKRYRGDYETVAAELGESNDLRVLDLDGYRVFRRFALNELGPAVFFEGTEPTVSPPGAPIEGDLFKNLAKRGKQLSRHDDILFLEDKLAEWDARIGQLRAMMNQGDYSLRACCKQELDMLAEKRHQAEAAVSELRLREAESWEEENFRTGLLDIFDEIGNRLNRLVTRMREKAGATP